MTKHTEGTYLIKANEESFRSFTRLEQRLSFIKGVVQNDTELTATELYELDKEVKDITQSISTLFENIIEGSVYLGETNA